MKKEITLMALLAVVEISLALYLTEWRHVFWDIVANKQASMFLYKIVEFTLIALFLCGISAWSTYISSICAIKWRKTLNSAAYKITDSSAENLNQRIQDDCRKYPQLFLTLVFGFGKALVYVLVFSVALCVSYDYTYLLIVASAGVTATVVARWVALPLIRLNYIKQVAEATYRNDLTKTNFVKCVDIMFELARKTKKLQYFQVFYGQIGVIMPIIIVAPAYFASALTLGALMQAVSIMGTLVDNLSYGINSFDGINKMLSCRKRLQEIGVV